MLLATRPNREKWEQAQLGRRPSIGCIYYSAQETTRRACRPLEKTASNSSGVRKFWKHFETSCASQTWPEGVLLHSMTHQKDTWNKLGDGSSIQFITMTQDAETERIRYSDRRWSSFKTLPLNIKRCWSNGTPVTSTTFSFKTETGA